MLLKNAALLENAGLPENAGLLRFLPDVGIPESEYAAEYAGQAIPQPTGREPIRHLLIGSPEAVHRTILLLHQLGYAEPSAWSRLQPTDVPGQVMSILVRYLRIE